MDNISFIITRHGNFAYDQIDPKLNWNGKTILDLFVFITIGILLEFVQNLFSFQLVKKTFNWAEKL